MHPEAYAFVARVVSALPPRRRVVEIGSRDINGSVRALFLGSRYTGIDVVAGPGVDVVADGAAWQPEAPADTVVCCEVLEHAPEAEAICRNAYEMLSPGGYLILTAATEGRAPHSAVDGGPLREGEFYRNVSEHELRGWLALFESVAVTSAGGDIYALARKEGAPCDSS